MGEIVEKFVPKMGFFGEGALRKELGLNSKNGIISCPGGDILKEDMTPIHPSNPIKIATEL